MPSSCTNVIINKDTSGPQVKIKTQCQEFRQKKENLIFTPKTNIQLFSSLELW